MSQMEKVITSLVERKAPFNGPVESDVWNDSIEEMVHSIGLLQNAWNTLLYPLLGSLPGGPVEVTAADRVVDPNPFNNGLDGSQIHMDMTAIVSDTSYYSETNSRPYTIKEAFEIFKEDIDAQIQEAREAAVFAGINEEQKERIGANIFYVNRTSSPSSLHGESIWLRQAVEQLIADIFNEGTDADSPPNLALYPIEEGLQTRDNTLMEYILSLLYYHDNSLGTAYLEVHHAFADPALEGSDQPQVYSNMVKAVGLVDEDFAGGSWPGVPAHLEDELNQLRTAHKRGLGSTLWTNLPLDPWDSSPLSLQGHMNRTGTAAPTEVNPHGLTLADIGYVFPTAAQVTYTPGGGVVYLGGATNVKEALEILDAEIGISSGSLAAEVSARIAADNDLQTQIDDLFADEIQHAGAGTNYIVADTDVDAALTTLDGQIFTNAGDITTINATLAVHEDHVDGTTNPAHDGDHISFVGNQSPPLTSTNVEAAVNELHGIVQTAASDITAFQFDGDKIATSPAAHARDPEKSFTFYVDPVTGDDQDNRGYSDEPFKTINRALDEVGANVMFPVKIYLVAGAYTECLRINKEMSNHGYILLKGLGAGPANVTIDPGTAITQPKGTETPEGDLEVLFTSGTYTGIFEAVYTVAIDSEGTPDTFSYYRNEQLIDENIPIVAGTMDLERGINLEWDTDTGHIANERWSFRAIPAWADIIQVINTPKVHFENFEVQNANGDGIRIVNGSKVVANNINVDSCNRHGIDVSDHSTLVMTNYDLSLNGLSGLRSQKHSHAQLAAGTSAGGNNGTLSDPEDDHGLHADWYGSINTCTGTPGGTGGATGVHSTRPGYIETGDCWTTTTTSTSTTTTTTT